MSCCKNCDKRTPVCHAWCDSYKEWAEKNQKRLEAMAADRDYVGIARYRMVQDKWMRRVKQFGRMK